jgi:hypothetical protein
VRNLIRAVAIATLVAAYIATSTQSSYASTCGDGGRTNLVDGFVGAGAVGAAGNCGGGTTQPTDIAFGLSAQVAVIDCGFVTAADDRSFWNKNCGPTGAPCPPIPGNPNPHAFIMVSLTDRKAVPLAEWCAGGVVPVPSTAALHDEVVRLLVAPTLGVSPNTGSALVHLPTLFWVNTPREVELGRSKLVGFPVSLRVHYLRTEFDFGDGGSGVLTPGVGIPYDPGQDCGDCADRFGHSYADTGPVTVTARAFWTGQFRVGTGTWVDIPGEVTAVTPSTTSFTVRQSRTVLVRPSP